MRGFAKPGSHSTWQELNDAHREYCVTYDASNFVVRGSIFDDAGEQWQGTAALIALPDRDAVDAFLGSEPFHRHGLFGDFLVHRYKFGGRPGQVT